MKEELINLAYKLGFEDAIYPLEGKDYFIWLCLLQKWLREEHLMNLAVIPGLDTITGEAYFCSNSENNGRFKTWEEALEQGLQEALKLIKL